MPLSKIQTAVITDNAITTAKVNADAITNAKLADDAIQTENVASSVNLGRRNLIFNGAMQVWQRSTDDTESGTGWGFRHADRYYTNKGRYRKETATIDGREWDIMHIDDAGAGYNGGRGMIYKHEYYRDYSNTLTLSFYAKASSSSTVNVGASNFGGSQLISGQNVTLTTSWNRYNFQLTASSAPTQTGETYIINALDNGVDYYITGIQMEVGTTATPFEHRSFGEELSLCRRYFCKTYNHADAVGSVGSGYWAWTKTTSQRWDIPLYQGHGMRATPTIVAYNASTGTAGQYRNASNGTNHTVGTFQATQNMLFIDENYGNWNNLGTGSVGRMFVTADAEL